MERLHIDTARRDRLSESSESNQADFAGDRAKVSTGISAIVGTLASLSSEGTLVQRRLSEVY
jgi:hypothetical protein